MAREMLSEDQWLLIEPLLPGKAGDPGRTARDNRLAVEGMLWVLRTGSPWRDVPERFGCWSTLYKRYRRWTASGVFERVFGTLDYDLSTVMIDGTYIKSHQHASGALKRHAPRTSPGLVRESGEVAGG